MFKKLNLIFILIIAIAFLQCSKKSTKPIENNPSLNLTPAERSLLQSDNSFGLKLFREVVKEEKDKNIFISPLSVSMALGMTYNGANGKTQEAMQKTLELDGLTIQEVNESYKHLIELLTGLDPKVQFQIANSIWYRQEWTFEEEFVNLNKTYFNALVSGLDFSEPNAADVINAWVDENTHGRIKEIVDKPINPDMVMFLINAIYFKGIWKYQFNKEATIDWPFNLPGGSTKTCQLMGQKSEYPYFENDDFQAVNLPYGDGDFSMIIFLPLGGKNIDSLIAKFDQENFNYLLSSFHSDSGKVFIPKFTLEYDLTMNDALKALGMAIAFNSSQADFTKMYKPGGIWIDKVKHKTFVEVNEEGTEAAGVTSVGMATSAYPPPRGFEILVDRPFIFVIRENQSQTILFIGKIVEPTL